MLRNSKVFYQLVGAALQVKVSQNTIKVPGAGTRTSLEQLHQ